MPWKAVSIAWPAIVAALLPLDLTTLIARLPHIMSRLAALEADAGSRADNDRSRPHQLDAFRSRFASSLGVAA